MTTLAEIQKKYGIENAKYEPGADCKYCHGTGELYSPAIKQMTFCACMYLAPELRTGVLFRALARTIKIPFPPKDRKPKPREQDKENQESPR